MDQNTKPSLTLAMQSLRFWLGMKPEEQAEAFVVLYLYDKKIASEDEIKNFCLYGFKVEAKGALLKLMKHVEKDPYRLTESGNVFARELLQRYAYFLSGASIQSPNEQQPEQKKTQGRPRKGEVKK